MATINFKAEPSKVGPHTIVRLPGSASAKLPSRGMVMVKGSVNGARFQAPLEPDGKGSHWLKVDGALSESGAQAGRTTTVTLEPIKEWPEPEIPVDIRKALAADHDAYAVWTDITPMARWDWLRWIRSTHNPETRKRRIEVACSKLKNGSRRPCCFNRTECTDPSVSKSGVLIDGR